MTTLPPVNATTDDASLKTLCGEVATARAEEGVALRHAMSLRTVGSAGDVRDAMRHVDTLHSRLASLELQLRKLRQA
jgi:hypothetical protein